MSGYVGPNGQWVDNVPQSGGLTAQWKLANGFVSGASSLMTAVIGNSIAGGAYGPQRNANAPTKWYIASDLHNANALLGGGAIRFGRMTASTRADAWGVYSYSGQTLATINADLAAQLYDPLVTAGIVPDLIVGYSLLENDIGAGATYAQCLARLQRWEYEALGRYPQAILWVMTPRPSFSYDTAAKVAVYRAVSDYIMARDDGRGWFATLLNGYESASAPGTPTAGFTDASVHPRVKGSWVLCRAMVDTLRRINGRGVYPYRAVSVNFALDGTGAASGTGISGTVPTGVTHSATSNGTVVCTANQPSLTMLYTQAAAASSDVSSVGLGQVNVTGTQFSPYVKVRVDSGAENLRSLATEWRVYDGSTSPFVNAWTQETAQQDGEYVNGDEFVFRSPPIVQADSSLAGAITSIQPYLRTQLKTGGTGKVLAAGSVQLTVLDAGVALVA